MEVMKCVEVSIRSLEHHLLATRPRPDCAPCRTAVSSKRTEETPNRPHYACGVVCFYSSGYIAIQLSILRRGGHLVRVRCSLPSGLRHASIVTTVMS